MHSLEPFWKDPLRKEEVAEITRALSSLPAFRSSSEIALFLKRKNIRGRQRSNSSCPLGVLFSSLTNKEVFVTTGYFTFYDAENTAIERFTLPPAYRLFIRNFDNDFYPALIAKETENAY